MKRREIVYELALKLNTQFDRNTVGLFVWAKLPKTIKSSEKFIDEVLYNYNIFIAPGSIFGSQGSRFIRFSLCIDEKLIKTAIKRLTK